MSNMNKRLAPTIRADQILDAALTVARSRGFSRLTLVDVAEQAGVTHSLVLHYYSTVAQLKRSVMRAAIDRKVLEVVAEGLAIKDRYALAAPPELRKLASQRLAG